MSGRIRKRHLTFLVTGALIATMFISPGPAAAHNQVKSDEDDSPGPLDVSTSSVSHRDGKVFFVLTMSEAWSNDILADDDIWGTNGIDFELDSRNTNQFDFRVRIDVDTSGTLYGLLVKADQSRSWPLVATRPDSSSVRVRASMTLLKINKSVLGWRGSTVFADADSTWCPGACIDYFPSCPDSCVDPVNPRYKHSWE